MLKIKMLLGVLSVLMIIMVTAAYAGHYKETGTSPILMHLAGHLTINEEWAMPGDEVGIFNGNGKLIGSFVVEKKGMFGDMVVNGDYEVSEAKEGALEGYPIFVRVWQKATETEYAAQNISISRPANDKFIYTSYPGRKLYFDGGMFYLLNIHASDN